MHILRWGERKTFQVTGLAELFLKFNWNPRLRVIYVSHSLSLRKENSTFAIKEELQLSEFLSCTVPIYVNLFPPPKVSNDYSSWKIICHFFNASFKPTKKFFQNFKLEKRVICLHQRDNSCQSKNHYEEEKVLFTCTCLFLPPRH